MPTPGTRRRGHAVKRALVIVVWAGMVAAWGFGGKRSDVEVLARVGTAVARQTKAALPDASRVAGPFVAFRPGDALPVEERVRVRIRTDKDTGGADVTVLPGAVPGEVRLRGIVPTPASRARAVELAEGTVGVDRVVDEIAVPER